MVATLIQEQIGAKNLSSVRASQYKVYNLTVAADSGFSAPANLLDVGANLQTKCGIKLSYDGGTAAFNLGQILSGADSGATGTIIQIGDSVAEGTLQLNHVSGTFQNDEIITDDGGVPGTAVVNGVASLILDYRIPAISGFIVTDTSVLIKFNSLNEDEIDFDVSGGMGKIWTFSRGDFLVDKIYFSGQAASPGSDSVVQVFVCGSKYIQSET